MASRSGPLAALVLLLASLGASSLARAQAEAPVRDLPQIAPPLPFPAAPLARVEVVTEGTRWQERPVVVRARPGEGLTAEVARRAMRELLDTGRFASVRAHAVAEPGGPVLRIVAEPRRIAASVKVVGGVLDDGETLRAANLRVGSEVTEQILADAARRAEQLHERHGYRRAKITVDATDTDERMKVVVVVNVEPRQPDVVHERVFRVDSQVTEALGAVLRRYEVREGDRLDVARLEAADGALELALRKGGWHRARVAHQIVTAPRGPRVEVLVWCGPQLRVVFEGNRYFDDDDLRDALSLDENDDRSPASLAARVREFYVARGFLDAEVTVEERGAPHEPVHDLVFRTRSQRLVRVVAREYPCFPRRLGAGAGRTPDDVGAEIDSFLAEELPGAGLVGSVDPAVVDDTFGPGRPRGARPAPLEPNPYNTYSPDVYERALKHLQNLYRSEGHLSAEVGPVAVLRRACDPRSPPGHCRPAGPRARPRTSCRYDAEGLPAPEPPPDASLACVSDPQKGLTCEPEVVLSIPIKLGPRTMLYDLAFEGNRALVERDLERHAGLEMGAPVSQSELDKARRRLLEAYAEEGFAFAEADVVLDFSPDRTRARARFVISERERVRVSKIVVRGNLRTLESVIRRRIALEPGQPYRRSLVRKTEERLATLGVFSTITVGLDEPYIPAKEKVVVVTVQERPSQHLDVRPGFSTGEGLRVMFEYGHRNVAGRAIQLTFRVQLSYLPDALILEDDVRENFQRLPLSKRLERRNTASIEFPDVGLGPLIRLGVDGVDVRDNARDFGLTKDAGIVTFTYRPNPRFSVQLGGSLELNDAEIFSGDAVDDFLRANPSPSLGRLLRVPDGKTFAVAQRTGITWDRRDNPFGATSGTLLAAGVEHVRAFPAADNPRDITSDFLRLTSHVAGYVRLSDKGLAVAGSLKWGYNFQLLENSKTYPDRLFFLGGVDTLRGFLQDSVVPQDIADRILDPATPLTVDDVAIRGGDLSLNPRAELRVPLTDVLSTALFLDAGNLWVRPENVDPLTLRYAAGSGLRAGTPIGPLAFDYGINLDRRPWEDFGAFHFSIGLF